MSEPPKKIKKGCTSIEGSSSGSDLDAATQKNLEAIDNCQIEIDKHCIEASEEILKIEQKFNLLKKPLFEKRSEIIKNVPNFWFTTIMNHPDLSSLVDEKEEECLQFLNRIEVVEFEDIKCGYEIQFHFEENPFFENSTIKKEFHLGSDPPSSHSTQIEWKDDNDLNSGKSGSKRHLESKSFFSWFFDNVDPVSDDIAEIFKDDLWANPLQYYFWEFLGINLHSNLSWTTHVDEICKKISKSIYLIRRMKQIATHQTAKTAYYACVHSHLTYGILLWGQSSREVFKQQKKAIRALKGLGRRESCRNSFREEKILTVTSIFIKECLKYIHQHKKSMNLNQDQHEHDTRRKHKLITPLHRLARTQQFFDYWGVKFYNSLPSRMKTLPMNEFDRTIKEFLINGSFYSIEEYLSSSML